jgi:hypothetical protein
MLKLADKDQLSSLGKDAIRYEELDKFLGNIQHLLAAVPVVVSKTYFKHAQTQKQLFRLDNI